MRILVSNDDGIDAIGLRTLARALEAVADVVVVAPDRDRSGASNSLTLEVPVRVTQVDARHWRVAGTPTDCVHIALSGLISPSPDLVVSGINNSANLGDDTIYSGTVAAAMEGHLLGLPAIAVSLASADHVGEHFATAAEVAVALVRRFAAGELPRELLLNVNVPDVWPGTARGMRVTRLGFRHRAQATSPQLDPRGRTVYWIGPPGGARDTGPGTDFEAVAEGYVSITPLTVDLTRHAQLAAVAGALSS